MRSSALNPGPRVPAALLLAALLLAAAACSPAAKDTGLEVKIPVRVEEAARGDIEERLEATGTVRAVEAVSLSAPMTGFLALGRSGGRRLLEGDAIRKGQLVFSLESEETRVSRGTGVDARRAELAQAEEEYNRYKRLFDQGIVSELELRGYESRLAAARYNYENARIVEEQTRMLSPIGGTLTYLTREVDGAKVAAGSLLAEVMDYSQVIVDLELPGADISRVAGEMAVRVTSSSYADRAFDGRVRHISPTIDSTSRTFRVEVLLDNAEGLLKPGMFVKAAIVTQRREGALLVPKHAVVLRGGRPVVFVVTQQKAEQKEVVPGLTDAERAEILSGIEEGDRVVVQGYETLKDKSPVKVGA